MRRAWFHLRRAGKASVVTTRLRSSFLARPATVAIFVACGLFGSCTQGDDFVPPQAAEPADAFVAAWDEGDAAAMVDLFDADSAPEWSERRLDRLLGSMVDGVVQSVNVARKGDVTQPEVESEEELEEAGLEATVPYTVSYGSEALESRPRSRASSR